MFNENNKGIIDVWNGCNRHLLIEGKFKKNKEELSNKIINYMDSKGFFTLILTQNDGIQKVTGLNNSPKIWFTLYDFVHDVKEPLTIDLLVIEDAAEIPHDFISTNIIWKNILITSDHYTKIPSFFSGEIIILGD